MWIEFSGRRVKAVARQLAGDERAQAWQRITTSQPRYAGHEGKTDRSIPVIRLAAAS